MFIRILRWAIVACVVLATTGRSAQAQAFGGRALVHEFTAAEAALVQQAIQLLQSPGFNVLAGSIVIEANIDDTVGLADPDHDAVGVDLEKIRDMTDGEPLTDGEMVPFIAVILWHEYGHAQDDAATDCEGYPLSYLTGAFLCELICNLQMQGQDTSKLCMLDEMVVAATAVGGKLYSDYVAAGCGTPSPSGAWAWPGCSCCP